MPTPHNVGMPDQDSSVVAQEAHDDWLQDIGVDEMVAIANRLMGKPARKGYTLSKVFCPTGPGGGVDPSCSPGGSGGASEERPHTPREQKADEMVKALGGPTRS